jgi:UDP-glucose 4-epimerase
MDKEIKNILVIGGCGFIGSHLCKELVVLGHTVTCIDNYFTGTRSSHTAGVSYIEADANDINELSFSERFSLVFHLGEYSRVEQSFDDIDVVFKYNHGSIYNVLKFCRMQNCKLIYTGSSTKFGDDGANASASPYAWTKSSNTDLVKTFCDWFDLEFAITYFYNVYGGNEIKEGKYATLIAKYLSLAERGASSLPVVSPGTQMRNFTFIDDVVRALILIGEKGHGDGYGIGADKAYSILELAKLFNKDIELLPERRGNRLSAPLNVDKTKALGWGCEMSLQRYISERLAK